MSLNRHNVLASLAAAVVGVLVLGAVGTPAVARGAGYPDPTLELPRKTAPYPGVGPQRPYVQEILINTVVPLKDAAIINRTPHGFLFRGGQQNNDLTITQVDGRLNFVDSGTRSWKFLARGCARIDVPKGVGASCRVRNKFTVEEPVLVEVWPRLGDDSLDSSTLSALFDLSFLGDRGDDTARLGAGDDFFNGAQDTDTVDGGGGRDWLRTGLGDDLIDGGAGGDYLVGVHGNDAILGGSGDDRLFGLDGNDHLDAGDGDDHVSCGNGSDTASAKSTDRTLDCESVSRH